LLPLEGITVISLEHAVAAPFTSRHLADLGARVIKVERPGVGDFARQYDASVLGEASYFVWLNRGKESIELDLKQPDDLALLLRMIEEADVFLQNLAPGAAVRMGLDAATLTELNPRLIHASISGYGPGGPYSDKKAYDLLVQCESSLVAVTGSPEEPAKVGISVVDMATGHYAFSGILIALFQRERTGRGSTLQVSMLEAIGEWMMQTTYYTVYGGKPFVRTGAAHATISPYGPHQVADGTVFLGIQSDREWALLCTKVLGRPDLAEDPRFARNVDRVANNDEVRALIDAALADRSAQETVELLESQGIATARMRTPGEFFDHPQLAARERWRDIATPGGQVRALLPPYTFDSFVPAMGEVPALGQHTDRLRSEFGVPSGVAGDRL
jgi:itaconate CoA-transferase